MFEIKQRKKGSKPVFVLCLGFMCVSALTPVSTVFADPTNSNNSAGSSERLLSKKNCTQIMNDTYDLQLTFHHNDYRQKVVPMFRDDNAKKGHFSTDARMLPLFNEIARDPYSRAVHRKIFRLCGATNFNAYIEKDKRDMAKALQMYPSVKPFYADWGM